jgi:hypothetical protein
VAGVMVTLWSRDPLGSDDPEASCRGCGKGISLRPYGWEDADGSLVCVKAVLGEIGSAQRPDYVMHQPMPAGLRGAAVS